MKIEYAVMFGRLRCVVCFSWVLGLMASCGGGGGGGGGSGGAVDTTAPSVASAMPASGSSGASRIADLRVTLSEAANASTVSSANVRLIGENLEGLDPSVGADVSYDAASNTVVVNPRQPLLSNASYTLTLAGVQDNAGNNLLRTVIAFKTLINPTLRQVFYSAGYISYYYVRLYNDKGNQTSFVRYAGIGPDNASGQLTRVDYFGGAGEGNVWFTGDDDVSSHSTTSYDSNGNATRTISYLGAGADGVLFIADDPVSRYGDTAYETYGNRTRYTEYRGAGADGN